jgi:hypothetical protein
VTREDFARVANKAFGEHPECEPGTEEFLAILGMTPPAGNLSGVGENAAGGSHLSRSHNPRLAQRIDPGEGSVKC